MRAYAAISVVINRTATSVTSALGLFLDLAVEDELTAALHHLYTSRCVLAECVAGGQPRDGYWLASARAEPLRMKAEHMQSIFALGLGLPWFGVTPSFQDVDR